MKLYSTVSGDTFDIIAQKELGDSKLAGLIMEANIEHIKTIVFSAGVELSVPDVPENLSSNLPPWKRVGAHVS